MDFWKNQWGVGQWAAYFENQALPVMRRSKLLMAQLESAEGEMLSPRDLSDIVLRKLNPHTQEGYIRAVRKFAKYLGRSPDTVGVEDLRNFQLHLVDHGISPITLNATITGLKFFFDVTLGRIELMARMQPVHVPRTLPVILSREEAGRLITAAKNLKHQTVLSVAYGTGLRASEVVALKVTALLV